MTNNAGSTGRIPGKHSGRSDGVCRNACRNALHLAFHDASNQTYKTDNVSSLRGAPFCYFRSFFDVSYPSCYPCSTNVCPPFSSASPQGPVEHLGACFILSMDSSGALRGGLGRAASGVTPGLTTVSLFFESVATAW